MAAGNDIILGVTRAVDAAEHRAAVSRLETMSGKAASVAEAAAEQANPETGWAAEVRRAAAANLKSSASFAPPTDATANATDKNGPFVKFEAMLLQTMIEEMMPEDAEAVYGSGTAGKVWKSMLAEKVAMEIARTGSLGIAKQIAAAHPASPLTSTTAKADNA